MSDWDNIGKSGSVPRNDPKIQREQDFSEGRTGVEPFLRASLDTVKAFSDDHNRNQYANRRPKTHFQTSRTSTEASYNSDDPQYNRSSSQPQRFERVTLKKEILSRTEEFENRRLSKQLKNEDRLNQRSNPDEKENRRLLKQYVREQKLSDQTHRRSETEAANKTTLNIINLVIFLVMAVPIRSTLNFGGTLPSLFVYFFLWIFARTMAKKLMR